MANLTTQSSDTPSLANLVDELGNVLTDDLPPDDVPVTKRYRYYAFHICISIVAVTAIALV